MAAILAEHLAAIKSVDGGNTNAAIRSNEVFPSICPTVYCKLRFRDRIKTHVLSQE
jgi:hypothetical protein